MLRVLLVLFAAGVAVIAYAALIERNWYALRRHTVPCLPAGSAPLRILHISDLHLRAVQRRKQRWLRSLARLEPDLIVATGDLLGDDDPRTPAVTAETVAAIPARLAALYVLGSNDYYAPVPKNPLRYFRRKRGGPHIAGKPIEWRAMVRALDERGWRLINNTALQVDGIDIVGLDDAHIGRADMSVASARTGEGFRLAVAHSPDSAEPLAALGYDLIVCGHTHGGQVCVPGVGALVTNCSLPRRMASGLHRFRGTWLHVSAGLGTSMFAPYRLACRPEACLLELVPAEDQDVAVMERATSIG